MQDKEIIVSIHDDALSQIGLLKLFPFDKLAGI